MIRMEELVVRVYYVECNDCEKRASLARTEIGAAKKAAPVDWLVNGTEHYCKECKEKRQLAFIES